MTTSAMAYVSGSSYFDMATGAVKAANLYFYRAGTLDPITTYTDSGLSIPHPVPVLTTGAGRVPAVWVAEIEEPGYRVRAFDQYSVLIEDTDNIPGPGSVAGGGGGGDGEVLPEQANQTGDIILAFSNSQPRIGAVLANGTTVGPTTATTASGRANDDTYNLFKWLWGQDQFGLLPVLPSRGATAQGDWDTGTKVITLPDLRGKVLVGMDNMGTGAVTNRLVGVPMSAGTPDKLAARGGESVHQLTLAESALHNHSISASQAVHSHYCPGVDHLHLISAFTSGGGAHTHTGYSDVQGDHAHSYTAAITTGLSPYSFAGNAAQPQGAATSVNGAHQHNITTYDGQGAHNHPIGINHAAADRSLAFYSDSQTPAITVSSVAIGGDAVHNTTPLFVTVCVYLKL